MTIRRAWYATCLDGELRDRFANAVAHRITQIDHCPGDAFVNPELREDFVERCDAIFSAHNPETIEQVDSLANEIDTTELYDLVENWTTE